MKAGDMIGNSRTSAHAVACRLALAGLLALSAGACSVIPEPSAEVAGAAKEPMVAMALSSEDITVSGNDPDAAGKEYFSAAAYGVAASPRVATGPKLRRGGGYLKTGSSYTVKGKRYHPTERHVGAETGRASWYGSAFHGRLTANGEVFDMNHLTGAHKTMPLPSYARVTNMANGHSVIVRINDRGPFSNDRVIDLSKRAAEVLDFIRAGTAEVKVEYAGRAPLHGDDDAFLEASARVPASRATEIAEAEGEEGLAERVSTRINGAFGAPHAGLSWLSGR